MGYHDKKYYKQRYEELDNANDKLKAEVDSLKNSIKFLLRQKNPHNVVYKAAYTYYGESQTHTYFEYVDAQGLYHEINKEFKFVNLTLLSTSADTAVFGYQEENKTTYWLLNKASELFAEIPEAILCHRNTKICEEKSDE